MSALTNQIEEQLAYLRAGGGRKSTAQQAGQVLASFQPLIEGINTGAANRDKKAKADAEIAKSEAEAQKAQAEASALQPLWKQLGYASPNDLDAESKANQAKFDAAKAAYNQQFTTVPAQPPAIGPAAPTPQQLPPSLAQFKATTGVDELPPPSMPAAPLQSAWDKYQQANPGQNLKLNPMENSRMASTGLTTAKTQIALNPEKAYVNKKTWQITTPDDPNAMSLDPKTAAGIASRAALQRTKQDSAKLDDKTVDWWANQVLLNPKEAPSFGMGGATQRKQVFDKAAQLATQKGDTASAQAVRIASLQSDKLELNKLKGQQGLIMAFENTAKGNLQNFLDTLSSVPDTDTKILNTPIRQLTLESGDPNVAKFLTAQHIAATEIGKVLQGGTGTLLTNDARHEVEDVLNKDYTIGQLKASASVLLSDMENRKKGFADEETQILSHMTSIGQQAPHSGQNNAPNSGGQNPPAPTTTPNPTDLVNQSLNNPKVSDEAKNLIRALRAKQKPDAEIAAILQGQ